MSEFFSDLGLDSSLLKALKAENITIPTDIQKKAIPQLILNKDVIIHSPTATGKTLSYLLPLFEKIREPSKEMKAFILAPTHELAIQIQRQIERLSENSSLPVFSVPIIGSANIKRQIESLKSKPQIVVGSPGRILELIQKKKIKAHTVKTVIIDEADRLLDKKNIDSVQGILKTMLKERQLVTASASMPQKIIDTAKSIMNDPLLVRAAAKQAVPESISHIYFKTEQRDKIDFLKRLIKNINPIKAVVFINSPGSIDNLTAKLKYNSLNAESLHGTNIKKDRKKVMDDFRSGKLNILVASDIAARGLQMDGITHIFNMDIPEKPNDYLHRSGRTGRNSMEGIVISLVTSRELPFLKNIQKELKINIPEKVYYRGEIQDQYNKSKTYKGKEKQPEH